MGGSGRAHDRRPPPSSLPPYLILVCLRMSARTGTSTQSVAPAFIQNAVFVLTPLVLARSLPWLSTRMTDARQDKDRSSDRCVSSLPVYPPTLLSRLTAALTYAPFSRRCRLSGQAGCVYVRAILPPSSSPPLAASRGRPSPPITSFCKALSLHTLHLPVLLLPSPLCSHPHLGCVDARTDLEMGSHFQPILACPTLSPSSPSMGSRRTRPRSSRRR